ncbi:hypothetical protein OS493_031978, partial [Desmophyllum pertusum]
MNFDVVDKNGIPTDKTKSFCIGVISSSGEPCKTTMRTYSKEYLQEPAIAVATYWRKQLGETMAKWANIAEILQSMVDKHKRSLPLLERIQFEREVAADIAKEKRMMQKRET